MYLLDCKVQLLNPIDSLVMPSAERPATSENLMGSWDAMMKGEDVVDLVKLCSSGCQRCYRASDDAQMIRQVSCPRSESLEKQVKECG